MHDSSQIQIMITMIAYMAIVKKENFGGRTVALVK